jgi:hypothetical protein
VEPDGGLGAENIGRDLDEVIDNVAERPLAVLAVVVRASFSLGFLARK